MAYSKNEVKANQTANEWYISYSPATTKPQPRKDQHMSLPIVGAH